MSIEDARHQGYLEGLRDANAGIAAEREAGAAGPAALTPVVYGHIYEWDYAPGVVHRDCSYGIYNGRYPDRTVTVYAAPAPTPPTFDRDSAEAWMLRAQVSLKQQQLGAAQMEIENALNILRPKE